MALKFFVPARLAALAASLFFGAPALAADYQTDLSPMPLDDETKFIIDGRGNATASYDGKTFTVKGDFKGMPSNAISALIFSSHLPGMPGPKQFDLEVTKSTRPRRNSACCAPASSISRSTAKRRRKNIRGGPRARCGAGCSPPMKWSGPTCRSRTTGSFPSSMFPRANPPPRANEI